MPFGCGSRLTLSLSASRIVGWLASRRARRAAGGVEQAAVLVGDEHQIGAQLGLVIAGDRFQRLGVVGVDAGLQLGQVGDEPRHQREGAGALDAQVVDLRRGGAHLPFRCARLLR
jgi:hypothetical protein